MSICGSQLITCFFTFSYFRAAQFIEGIHHHGRRRDNSSHTQEPDTPNQPSSTWGKFKKVLVPAIYKEWNVQIGDFRLQGSRYLPFWFVNQTFQEELGYTTVLYQKQNSSAPHFISTNRGCENGAYYNFIVDYYHDFPDIALFVHAKPEEHMDGWGMVSSMEWLNRVKCIRPNISYTSLKLERFHCKSSWNGLWARKGIWIEQCLRDTLQITWDLMDNQTEFHRRIPPRQEIRMCMHCCQQFAISRAQVLKRPLRVWKQLLDILSVQDQCHVGEPDYENLYAFHKSSKMRLGSKPVALSTGKGGNAPGFGRYTQAVAAEHLAHVIFGHRSLEWVNEGQKETCRNFFPSSSCTGSPC